MELFYKGLRCCFVALIYIANEKIREGLSLLEYSSGVINLGVQKL